MCCIISLGGIILEELIENYKKLNVEIGKAFILTNDIKTKKILINIVELAHELYPKTVNKEEFDKFEESFYDLYTDLLLNNAIDEQCKGNIIIGIDKLLMDKRPIETEKALVRTI